MPETIPDGLILNPQTSYGTQKAIGELLVQDYARKGYVDGRALRFPTVVVRPGKPNKGGLDLGELHHPRTAAGRGKPSAPSIRTRRCMCSRPARRWTPC